MAIDELFAKSAFLQEANELSVLHPVVIGIVIEQRVIVNAFFSKQF